MGRVRTVLHPGLAERQDRKEKRGTSARGGSYKVEWRHGLGIKVE